MQRFTLGIGSVVLCLLAGCGGESLDYGPLGTLKGKVTFKGEPFTQGTVILSDGKSGTGAATLKSDGTFFVTDRIGGIPVGTYNIAFQPETKEVSDNPNSPPREEAVFVLPKKYYSTDNSGLTVEIKPGENTVEFDVTK